MEIEVLSKRIQDLNDAIAQSSAQHNALVGRLEEAKWMLSELVKKDEEKKQEEVVEVSE